MPDLGCLLIVADCNVSLLRIPPEVWANKVQTKGSVEME